MNSDEVARAHQFRDGYTLVDYGEVGLPVFRLTIEAVTTSYRSLAVIHEFTMRSMLLGVTREEEIARLLGLQPELIAAAIDMLVTDRYVTRQAGALNEYSFQLTEAGQARLAQEKEEVPQEEMLVIDYDGVVRKPIRLAGINVVRAAELRTRGSTEIRPYPAEPPAIDELSIPDVTKVIRRQRSEDFHRTVLALKRIVRRNNVFREAVALVFAADHGNDVQVAFAIDGKLSEAHERTFAEHGGPRKMGFIRAMADTDVRRRLHRLAGRDILRSYPEKSALVAARREEAEAEASLRTLEPAGRNAKRGSPPATALQMARNRVAAARHVIDVVPTRPLACYEQDRLLEEALQGAKKSLIITTAGLQPIVVTGFMLRQFDVLYSQGVRIIIETTLVPKPGERGKERNDPLFELITRSKKGHLRLDSGPKRELYFLIKDEDLAVISSRPFLGEMPQRSGFIRVDGIVTREPENVLSIKDTLLKSLTDAKRII
ncbi:hypothetical protein EN866_34625 [Mesorhizobium sp. M2D.F.Ca.ET.223.01.1.1]|uniref:hypothetical protein n=1 Tax=Mesorhizobium sp. M2D.F.Ca.ET.223.01.1.1 TaxID=2563940 RepID=UPI001091B25F|nr:hypothetical protein [Mesorhizobium sp. M2D.F.Ca.ET.223.01.1.1]TGR82797.1 hypothetical protein EN866_34625 [Mesorhizobium sp. M2D.F.Ca.ET.223.01.1.1]TGT78408.1 hypothetical protein EN802_01825 [bacterium M00.F.Ca.ET.159.01.1.1]TGT89075.1 hypothetical protein EN800_01825 [bacterium M00.F.Ca.ET.157.01.1.1]